MILISHRGNIDGRIEDLENRQSYIKEAIDLGYHVEIDLWLISDSLYLGHDDPTYKVDIEFLDEYKDKLWIHCKNIGALSYLLKISRKHRFFFHENEKYVLTSLGDLIVHGQTNRFPEDSVYMMPEILNVNKKYLVDCKGVCSDNIKNYLEWIK